MGKIVVVLASVLMCVAAVQAEDAKSKALERVDASKEVLQEIMAAPDKGIPEDILASAECVIVIPSMKKGGFVFGANYGRGVATCRLANDLWSATAPVRIEGGSWGLQIGGQAVDLLMLVMNKNGTENLLKSKFKIGADASAAAGPVGRQAEGSTDWRLKAEMLTYSRARGLFAGVTLNGAVLKQDEDDTVAMYGENLTFRDILTGKIAPAPESKPFLNEIAKDFRAATTQEAQGSGGKQESGSGNPHPVAQ